MRRHHAIPTFTLALVIIGALLSPATAGSRTITPASSSTCYGVPSPVRAQADGSGVRAGKVVIHCATRWDAFQGIMWFSDDADQYGKWSYGGTRHVTGRGATTIPPWLRPYHGCGYWKQQITIGTETRYSTTTWLCA